MKLRVKFGAVLMSFFVVMTAPGLGTYQAVAQVRTNAGKTAPAGMSAVPINAGIQALDSSQANTMEASQRFLSSMGLLNLRQPAAWHRLNLVRQDSAAGLAARSLFQTGSHEAGVILQRQDQEVGVMPASEDEPARGFFHSEGKWSRVFKFPAIVPVAAFIQAIGKNVGDRYVSLLKGYDNLKGRVGDAFRPLQPAYAVESVGHPSQLYSEAYQQDRMARARSLLRPSSNSSYRNSEGDRVGAPFAAPPAPSSAKISDPDLPGSYFGSFSPAQLGVPASPFYYDASWTLEADHKVTLMASFSDVDWRDVRNRPLWPDAISNFKGAGFWQLNGDQLNIRIFGGRIWDGLGAHFDSPELVKLTLDLSKVDRNRLKANEKIGVSAKSDFWGNAQGTIYLKNSSPAQADAGSVSNWFRTHWKLGAIAASVIGSLAILAAGQWLAAASAFHGPATLMASIVPMGVASWVTSIGAWFSPHEVFGAIAGAISFGVFGKKIDKSPTFNIAPVLFVIAGGIFGYLGAFFVPFTIAWLSATLPMGPISLTASILPFSGAILATAAGMALNWGIVAWIALGGVLGAVGAPLLASSILYWINDGGLRNTRLAAMLRERFKNTADDIITMLLSAPVVGLLGAVIGYAVSALGLGLGWSLLILAGALSFAMLIGLPIAYISEGLIGFFFDLIDALRPLPHYFPPRPRGVK